MWRMCKSFKIVRLSDPESFKQLELLQTEVWGRGEVIPYHVLIAFQRMGGVVLAAFDDRERLVGMLCGYNSVKNGQVFHYMHLCGVVSDMRAHGVATALKMKLREHLLNNGIELVKWLVDPLQIPEAYLSIHKLGAVGSRYEENFYGIMRDPYNRGLESDRLEVEWRLRSKRVEERISSKEPEVSVEELVAEGAANALSTVRMGTVEKVLDYKLNLKSDKILLEVPGDMDCIKKLDISAATEWREITRRIFQKYLGVGYLVTDLIRHEESGGSKYYYLLERNVSID